MMSRLRQIDAVQALENQQTRSFLSGLTDLVQMEIRAAALTDIVDEIELHFSSLNFSHSESMASDCLTALRDPLVRLALVEIDGVDADLFRDLVRDHLKKIKTTRPDGCKRAPGGGRKGPNSSGNGDLFGGEE